jgi:hypothetical protein
MNKPILIPIEQTNEDYVYMPFKEFQKICDQFYEAGKLEIFYNNQEHYKPYFPNEYTITPLKITWGNTTGDK